MKYCEYNADGMCAVCGHATHIAGLIRECGYTVPPLVEPVAACRDCGPGTELSKLLKRFGIEPTPTCQCRAKAAEMDAWGPDECEKPERIEEVVAVMRAEAEARGLPFLDVAGRMLVRRAIKNARRKAKMD
jgi:hypothetical protein